MKTPKKSFSSAFNFSILLLLLVATACNRTTKAPELPYMASDYEQPKSLDFSFTEPDSITWQDLPFPDIKTLPKKSLDLDGIDGIPFDLDNSVQLKKPIISQPINWDTLPKSTLEIDKWPKEQLQMKVFQLGKPRIVEVTSPLPVPQSSRGVFAVDASFGLDGNPNTVFKDRNNFIWFGCTNSIAKFNTNHLEIYGPEQGLDLTNANQIFEDSKGRFWIGDNYYLTVIDFQAKLVYQLVPPFQTGPNYRIAEDKQGHIWAHVRNVGINRIDFENATVSNLDTENGLITTNTVGLYSDSKNNIYISGLQAINILDLENNTNTKLTPETGLIGIGMNTVYEDQNGQIWIGNSNGVTILNKEKTSVTKISPENLNNNLNSVLVIREDTEGVYWLGTFNGDLWSIDLKNNVFDHYDIQADQNQIIWDLVFDNEGQVWIGKVTGGGNILETKGLRPGNYSRQNGLGDNNVWSTLVTKNDKVWIGTYNGVNIYDQKTKEIKYLSPQDLLTSGRTQRVWSDSDNRIWIYGNSNISIIDSNRTTVYSLSQEKWFKNEFISKIREIEPGVIWLGTGVGSLFILNLNDSTLKYFSHNDQTGNTSISQILKDNQNNIWYSTRSNGFHRLNKDLKTLTKVTERTGLISDQVFYAEEDENDLWIATLRGMQKLDLETQQSIYFSLNEGLAAPDVYDIFIDDNKIYSGTSKGISIISKMGKSNDNDISWQVNNIGREQGLTYIDVCQNSMSLDTEGRLWVGLDSQTLGVINTPEFDTVPPQAYITSLKLFDKAVNFEPKIDSLALTSNVDTIWKSTKRDYYLASNYINKSEEEKNLNYEGVTIPFNVPKNLKLEPNQNFVSFEYLGFQYQDQDKLSYTYFLEGIDKVWSPITKETTSENYRDLPAGNYTFKVAAKNGNNIWSKPAEFKFTILPYWWQTWWAYLIFALIATAVLWKIVQYRSQWLKRENRLLEEKVALRTTELRNKINQLKETQNQLIQSEKMASLGELTAGIAHEIQNPLNFVNNFSEINKELIEELQVELKQGHINEALELSGDIKNNEDKIIHHGKRADSIVKGMLMHSRNQSGQKELTDINALCDEYLRLSYHGLRAKDKSFNAAMETDFDPTIKKVEIVPQDIGRVVLNLLNNAFYAVQEKGKMLNGNYVPKVKISTEKEDGKIKIKIQDNGNGIPKPVQDKIFQPFFTTKSAGHGTGLGLSLSYDIIKAHNGIITLDTVQNEGTTFLIELPSNS